MKFIKRLIILAMICILLGVGTIFGCYLYLKPDLPDVAKLKDVELQTPLRVYSADGKLIAQFGEKRRIPLTLNQIPPLLIDGFIATEDSRFYEHHGVDPFGIARAIYVMITTGHASQGASTITQQLARNFFLTDKRTISRKVREAFIAIHIEQILTKDQILDLYLNKIYLGNRAYGVGAAAQVYFGKTVNQLTLSEMAMIAGLPKAPSTMNPIFSIDRATTRRNVVLGRMYTENYITKAQMDQARSEPIVSHYHGAKIQLYAPYVAEQARAWMVNRYGEDAYTKGMDVYTTINAKLQRAAQQSAIDNLLNYDERHGYRGATAVLWKPGQTPLNANQIVEKLSSQPTYGDLIPAVVTKVNQQTVIVVTKQGETITLTWNGIKWARKFITNKSQGPAPTQAAQILTAGQQIWVQNKATTVAATADTAAVTTDHWVLSQVPAANTSFVAMSPHNGAVLAMVGGFNYAQSQFNRVTQALRQVGSGIKPFIYSAAIQKGMTLATLINDAPITKWDKWQGTAWRPRNADGHYGGPLRARIGLAQSINVMAIRVLRRAGLNYTINYLTRFGFSRAELPHAEPLALGAGSLTPLALVQGYSVFVNGGYAVRSFLINKVDNYNGKLIYSANPKIACDDICQSKNPQAKIQVALATAAATAAENAPAIKPVTPVTEKPTLAQLEQVIAPPKVRYAPEVISEQNAFLVRQLLYSNIWGEPGRLYGTGFRARILGRHDIGGKTGTTNNSKDAWYTGFGPHIVATTWVGFDDHSYSLGRTSFNKNLGANQTTGGEYGGNAAQPAWINFMRIALKNTPEQPLQIPANIIKVRIDRATGKLSNNDNSSSMFEYFIKGTEPTQSVNQANSEQKFDAETAEQLF